MWKNISTLLILFLAANQIHAQNTTYTLLGETFVVSYNNPKQFEAFILVNKLDSNFDENFWKCYAIALNEYGPRGRDIMNECRGLPSDQYDTCVARNQAGLLTYWLLTIKTVIKDDSLWSETRLGSSLIAAQEDQNSIEVLGNLLGAGGVIKDSKEIANKYIQGISKTLYCNYKR